MPGPVNWMRSSTIVPRGFETDRNFLRVGDKYLMQPIKDEWHRQSGQQHARHPTNDVSSGLAQPTNERFSDEHGALGQGKADQKH